MNTTITIEKPSYIFFTQEELDEVEPIMSGGGTSSGGSGGSSGGSSGGIDIPEMRPTLGEPVIRTSHKKVTSNGKTLNRYGTLNVKLKSVRNAIGGKLVYKFTVLTNCKSYDGAGNPVPGFYGAKIDAEILSRKDSVYFNDSLKSAADETFCYPPAKSSFPIEQVLGDVAIFLLKTAIKQVSKVGKIAVLTIDLLDKAGVFNRLNVKTVGNVADPDESPYFERRVFELHRNSENASEIYQGADFTVYAKASDRVDFELLYRVNCTNADLDISICKQYQLFDGELYMRL